ncbi:type II toxin-antitoxin system RelE/ParE family toxin [Paraburkholderia antibiotica]|uniref:Type II toxin-antitoxin system RelE/ParE family toxin n=1 Tax=Paraburkholderia antibiotica TaxID=2728839 RepID=A0A7X9ZZH4_9BURK|nr:type II toxin-antitoxin system RelE/ParE family toxin [Paraburkholderia antibiotica]NML32633.1 type II toxin-antitoxin system RelE/ParE family toxin [Paraburkholderia antibiotica]
MGRIIKTLFLLARSYPKGYSKQHIETPPVITINRTEAFDLWLRKLRDVHAKAQILVRLRRAERGLFGNVKVLGNGVFEMRIDCGPGYRVYYAREASMTYLLLGGGDKSTQQADIEHAGTMWADIRKERP